jgi:hypothetical protein
VLGANAIRRRGLECSRDNEFVEPAEEKVKVKGRRAGRRASASLNLNLRQGEISEARFFKG